MERADDLEQLCAVLDEETRVCAALSAVLREEQVAVVRLQADRIVDCLGRREALQRTLGDLAASRRSLVRTASARRGGETLQAIELLPLLPPAPRDRLRGGLRRLRGALLETSGLERQNAHLAGQSLAGVDELIAALRAQMPGTTYGADATLTSPPAPDTLHRTA
ncbi:MAG: flagellar export chaperone FlgN [bacterium]|nr:flagellar export chaperone FlgN [bacterium]